MTQDLSQYNEDQLLKIVDLILTETLGVQFKPIRLGNSLGLISVDHEGNNKYGVLVKHSFEDIVGFSKEIEKRLKWFISETKITSFLVVVAKTIDQDESNEITARIGRTNIGFTLYDGKWIIEKGSNIKTTFNPNEALGKMKTEAVSQRKIKDQTLNELKINGLTGGNRSFYVAGHYWGKVNKYDEFIHEDRWENGHETNDTKSVNNARIGDIVFLKSTVYKDKKGTLRLKAVGVVTENLNDGHNLNVFWHEFANHIDLPGLGQYMRTFQQITPNYIDQALQGIIHDIPHFLDIVNVLVSLITPRIHSIQTKIQTVVNEDLSFGWYSSQGRHLEIGKTTTITVRHENFPFSLEIGSLLICYEGTPRDNIYGIAEITDKDLGNNSIKIQLQLLANFPNEIILKELINIPSFKRWGLAKYRAPVFHQIDKEVFERIINESEIDQQNTEPENIQNKAQKTKIDNDGAMAPKDFLGFENDIRAFSITLAQKRLVPPVAVALFGNWGTGKSFFMHHLERNIDHLSKYQGFSNVVPENEGIKPFCEGVAQIKFNAWSYLDTNLWAGLIANIFEKLDEYVSGDNVIEKEKQKAQKIIADKLDIVSHEKDHLKFEIEELTNQQERIQKELDEMQANKESIHDKVIDKSIDELKKEARKHTADLEKTIKDQLEQYGISKQKVEELSPSILLDEITSWVTFARNVGRINKPSQIITLFILIIFLAYFYFDPGGYLTGIKSLISDGIVYFISIGAVLFSKTYNSYEKYKALLKPVIEFKNKFNESFEKVKLDYDKSLINLNSQMASKTSEIFDQERKLAEVEQKIAKYEYALNHSVTKRAFFDFIQRKANEESYESHLGLISIIRRDFEKLSALFEQVNIPENITPEEKEELEKRKKENEDFRDLFTKPLDRIILYIDDLDRCDDDKVLEVLEAVHLLMAFPLFIVVVGVDKRCVSNALRYRNILKYTSMANVSPKELKEDYSIEVIEPEEYLEKIFQIPFRLKAAKPDAIKGLIGNLLKNEIEVEKLEDASVEETEAKNDKEIKESKGEKEKPRAPIKSPKTDYVAPEDLLITQTELDYLQDVSVIVGDTPRTIKRFVNIYRIIRAHEQLNYRKKEKDIDFLIIMFVLGLGIGNCRDKSEVIFQKCLANEDKNLGEILEMIPKSEKIKDMLEKEDTLKLLLSVSTSELNNYIHFVNRFSFN